MTLRINVFGKTYDDVEPCFLTPADSDLVYDRVSRKWLTRDSFDQAAASKGYAFGANEIGVPSEEWQKTNMIGFKWGTDSPAPEPVEPPCPAEDEVEVKEKKPKKKKEED